VASGRIAVVGTKVFKLSPLSAVRSNRLARLNIESGISPLCLQIHFCINTFKEGHAPPLYVGPAYHQPGLSSVTAPSAPTAVACTEVTSPPSTLGMTNGQSTPMRTNPTTSEGWVQLNTDLSASAMSGSVFQNCQVPPNWWGYGMPPEFFANSSRTSQVANLAGKDPMTSAPPVLPMTHIP